MSLSKSEIYEIMRVCGSKPNDFIQALAKLVDVGYYEPLDSWSLSVRKTQSVSCDV